MDQIRRSPGVPARATSPTAPLCPNHNPEIGQQLRRRRAATQRLPVLDCGCADPWPHRSDDATPSLVAGYVATVQLLDQLGYPAAPLLPELRAMWRQGDRHLVASVTTRWVVAQ